MSSIYYEEAIIFDDKSDALERNNKEQEYLEYIKNHVDKVNKAYYNVFVPMIEKIGKEINFKSIFNEEFINAINDAKENIEIHDQSKYDDEEFRYYRIRFYPTTKEKVELEKSENFKAMQDDFKDKAWRHHYKSNPHHSKYWVDEVTGVISDMYLKYIIEMICDWMSFGDDIKVWYSNKAKDEKASMSTRTKEIVDEILDILEKFNQTRIQF